MSWRDYVEISAEPLSHDAIVARAHDDGAGAIVTFIGITRNVFEGKKVIKLEYECYEPMVGPGGEGLCAHFLSTPYTVTWRVRVPAAAAVADCDEYPQQSSRARGGPLR